MQTKEMLKQIFEFNKAALTNIVKSLNMLQEQTEKVMNLYIDQAVGMSDESKKAARAWILMYSKGCEDCKKLVDDNFRKLEAFFLAKRE